MNVYYVHALFTLRSEEGISFLDLELQMLGNHHGVLWKSTGTVTVELSLQHLSQRKKVI